MKNTELSKEAHALAQILQRKKMRLVLAESCTGGLVAATLASIPGISENLCGSTVVYRNDTKTRWLGISSRTIKGSGPVSEQVVRKMAENVLSKTPEADIAAAITGHLGPNAPETQDGLVFIAVSKRQNSGFSTVINKFIILPQSNKTPEKLRQIRQKSASLHVLFMVRSLLKRRNSKGVS